jgi:RNA polymerase sigma factor (sigma-70 family)
MGAMSVTTAVNADIIDHAIRKESGRLRNFIRKRVSNREDAEDILQEVFYQFVSVMQLGTIEKVASWLYKVATNKITDRYRKQKTLSVDSLKPGSGNNGDEDMTVMLEDILFDPRQNPDILYVQSTVWPLLEEALEELPPEQRDVFIMHELDDMSFKEISEITGVPVNTLISRKWYAVQVLRDKLRDLYDEYIFD